MRDRAESTAPPAFDPADSGDVAIRYTFRIILLPEVARALDQAVAIAREEDCSGASFPAMIEAAADDLDSLVRFLDHYGDNAGDGPERHEIHLAAAVLDTVPVLAGMVAALRAQVQRARETAPEAGQ